MGEKTYEEVFVERVRKTTEKAALCVIDSEEYWIPFSTIEDNGEDFTEDFQGSIYVERWLCDEKGIDY